MGEGFGSLCSGADWHRRGTSALVCMRRSTGTAVLTVRATKQHELRSRGEWEKGESEENMNAPGLSARVEASVAVLTQDLRLSEFFSSTTRSPALLRLGTRGVHGVMGRWEEVCRQVYLGFV